MALYRNIAGGEKLGLLLDQFDSGGNGDTFALPETDGGDTYVLPETTTITDDSGNILLNLPTATTPPPVPVTYDPGFPIEEPTTTFPLDDLIKITDKPTTSIPLPGGGSALPVTDQPIDYMPLLTMGALVLTAVYGDRFLKKRRKLVFVGGLGLLYYQFARKE